MRRQDLRIVGSGKMVSKRRSDLSREAYKGSKLEQFNLCKKEAKVQLGIPANKFQPVGGKTPDGVRLLETTHAIRRMRFPEGPHWGSELNSLFNWVLRPSDGLTA